MRVLVTGGAGFIGSHLCTALLSQGYQVRVLDNFISGNRTWLHTQVELHEGDISDLATCREAMQNVQGVFHCAAFSRASNSNAHIEDCTNTNIIGTQNILISARDEKVKKIIYSGSSTYYGNQQIPQHERLPPSPFLNFYALSKYVGEQYVLMFDELFNLPAIILRYFNVYGPRQPMTGTYALAMGIFLHQWKNNNNLEIHGDGSQTRDFIHVHDVVSANIKAFESLHRHAIFNVGSGISHSIKTLARFFSDNHMHTERRLGDAEHTLADIRLIQEKLNWQPTISLADGVRELKRAFE